MLALPAALAPALALMLTATPLALGVASAQKGDDAHARHYLEEAIRADPNSAQAYHWLGVVHSRAGRHAQALAAFASATRLDPHDVEGWLLLGMEHDFKGDHRAAAATYRKAISADPMRPEGYRELGTTLLLLGDPAGAVTNLRQAARLSDDNPEVLSDLGYALGRAGQPAEAEKILRQVVERSPTADSQYALGDALAEQKKLPEAKGAYEAAIALDPGHALAHHHLGLVLLGMGDRAGAEKELRRALELRPGDSRIERALARVREGAGP